MICPPFKGCKLFNITQPFIPGQHLGVDFWSSYGTFLVAPEKCKVVKITTAKTFDNGEELKYGYGIRLLSLISTNIYYTHWHCLPFFPVKVGDIVEQGQVVAQMGNSGFVRHYQDGVAVITPVEIRSKPPFPGTHDHISKMVDGVEVDIVPFIDWNIKIEFDILTSIQAILNSMANFLKGR